MAGIYGELIRAQLHLSTADLTPVASGLIYLNTTINQVKWYANAAWHIAADLDTAQTLVNKTLTSPVITTANTNGFTDHVRIAEQGSSPATPASGFGLIYPKTDGKWYTKDDAGVEAALGAGSGAGELNLVESGSDATGWTTTGTNGPTATTTTTVGDLPLAGTIDTAIQMSSTTTAGVEANDYFSYPLAPGEALKNKKLKVDLWLRPGSNFLSGEWTVSVYEGANRVSLSTDSGGVTYLPNSTTKFTTTFDTDDSTAYTLRFARVVNAGTDVAVLNVSAIVVGPGVVAPVPAVGNVVSWTPTGSWTSNTTYSGYYQRIANRMVGWVRITTTGAPTSTALTLTLPDGLTADSTAYSDDSDNYSLGTLNILDSGSAGYVGGIRPGLTSNTIRFVTWGISGSQMNGTSVSQSSPMTWASGDELYANFSVPIAEWAGSPNYAGQNDVEYVFNTNTAGSTDTTSFGYGPGGVLFPNGATGTAYDKTVSFSPMQAGDVLEVEVDANTGYWVSAAQRLPVTKANTATYGIEIASVTATTAVIRFQTNGYQQNGATYGSNGSAWSVLYSSNWKWRVVKAKSGQAVGFGAATATASGLVKLPDGQVRLEIGNGHGSSGTKIRRFTTAVINSGTSITYADDSSAGATFTINESGIYAIHYSDFRAAGTAQMGISVNSNQLSTTLGSITNTHRVAIVKSATANADMVSVTVRLAATDVVRAHTDGLPDSTDVSCAFHITQVVKL